MSSPVNRTPSITTRTHASVSLGHTDESHIHTHVAVESVVSLAVITNVVSPVILSSVVGSVLDNRIMISNTYHSHIHVRVAVESDFVTDLSLTVALGYLSSVVASALNNQIDDRQSCI